MDHLLLLASRSSREGGAETKSSTCELASPMVAIPTAPIAGPYDFYHLNLIVSGACAAFASLVMVLLMWQHATHLRKPREQIHILRICCFIPVYAVGIWVMILVPRTYVYLLSFLVIYEAYALAYFYLLICEILLSSSFSCSSSSSSSSSPTVTTRTSTTAAVDDNYSYSSDNNKAPSSRDIFLAPLVAHARRKGRPVGCRRGFFSPLNRFRRHWVEVFQCPPLMVLVMVATVATQSTGTYCLTAHDATHAHLYLVVVQIASMVAAIIGVVHTYVPLRRELREHRALSKLWAFKLLIFLQVAQGLAFSILDGIAPPSTTTSPTLGPADLLIGLPLLITSCELVLFAVFFHYAYSIEPYRLSDAQLSAGERYAAVRGWRVGWEMLKIHDLVEATRFMWVLDREVVALEGVLREGEGEGGRDGSDMKEPGPQGGVVCWEG